MSLGVFFSNYNTFAASSCKIENRDKILLSNKYKFKSLLCVLRSLISHQSIASLEKDPWMTLEQKIHFGETLFFPW